MPTCCWRASDIAPLHFLFLKNISATLCVMVFKATSGSLLLLQKFNAGSDNHTEKIMSDNRRLCGIFYIHVFDAQKYMSK